MKKSSVIIFLLVLPVWVSGQIPVTDGAANTSLQAIVYEMKLLLKQVGTTNSLFRKNNEQNRRIINQNKEIVDYLKKTHSLKKEEIDTYKQSPDPVLVGGEMNRVNEIRAIIVEEGRAAIESIKSLKYLNEEDINGAIERISGIASSVVYLMNKINALINKSDRIMPAGQRQVALNDAIKQMELKLQKIREIRIEATIVNGQRKSLNQMYGFE